MNKISSCIIYFTSSRVFRKKAVKYYHWISGPWRMKPKYALCHTCRRNSIQKPQRIHVSIYGLYPRLIKVNTFKGALLIFIFLLFLFDEYVIKLKRIIKNKIGRCINQQLVCLELMHAPCKPTERWSFILIDTYEIEKYNWRIQIERMNILIHFWNVQLASNSIRWYSMTKF